MTSARQVIEALGMQVHPEGGWYAETWRAGSPDGTRPSASAIVYLLAAGDRSHWHRVDADEIW
ncbi:MAG TPA: cupin domain-containing protein, partial [Candidatus Limnocylindrales bacterium]|nr:cupin domain-containing protein [Candidatus Limnocylindrales bacterium]